MQLQRPTMQKQNHIASAHNRKRPNCKLPTQCTNVVEASTKPPAQPEVIHHPIALVQPPCIAPKITTQRQQPPFQVPAQTVELAATSPPRGGGHQRQGTVAGVPFLEHVDELQVTRNVCVMAKVHACAARALPEASPTADRRMSHMQRVLRTTTIHASKQDQSKTTPPAPSPHTRISSWVTQHVEDIGMPSNNFFNFDFFTTEK